MPFEQSQTINALRFLRVFVQVCVCA